MVINIPVAKANEKETTIYRYRCYLSTPIAYTSKDFDNMMNRENITQFVFSPIGLEEYSIGVCSSDEFSREYLVNQLMLNISQVNDDLKTNKRIEKVEIEDLQLIYFEFEEVHDSKESYESYSFKGEIDGEIYCLNALPEEIIEETHNASRLAINYCHHKIIGGRIAYHDGFSNSDSFCNTSLSSPHRGDGNRRYVSGHDWLPSRIYVGFTSNVSPGFNQTKLRFLYNSENFNNQNFDSNEALELEVIFFNYYNNPANRRGRAYQYAINCSWNSNMGSSAYLDTNFGDSDYEVHMCVGCSDTTTLTPNTIFYWSINSVADAHTDSYPNDGKFHIVCQRSYRYMGSGAWHVFAEEHEQLWYPLLTATLYWYVNSAYYYANTGTCIYYQKGDPVW